MGRVYSQATNTAIFLGEASHEEVVAAEAGLNAIFDVVDNIRLQADLADDGIGEDFLLLLLEKLPEQDPLDVPWSAIETLFGTDWFKRIWCIQEVALARDSKRHSYATYGHIRIQHCRINRVASCLIILRVMDVWLGPKIEVPDCIGSMTLLHDVDERDNYLLDYLANFRMSKATDPRDMVYGLLGMLSQHSDFDTTSISVDYARPLSEVYTDTASEIVRRSRHLALLDHASRPRGFEFDPNLPSWVPSWEHGRGTIGLPQEETEQFEAEFPALLPGCREPSAGVQVEGGRLVVCGTNYDEVIGVSSLLSSNMASIAAECWDLNTQEPIELFGQPRRIFDVGSNIDCRL